LFAKEGPAFVEYLKRKLAAARDDLEVRDIVLVLAEISRLKADDVARRPRAHASRDRGGGQGERKPLE
jgi:hypothetical protein